MPTVTHILVDFENVQPGAADIALLHGEGLRLAIFRGPGQMKYAADLAEAWQPLGTSVQFIRCAKAGRNAVDMHIAFHLGTLIDAHQQGGSLGALRLIVVSRDTDFDPLLLYIRSQGYDALRVPSIKAALTGGEARAAKKSAPRAATPAKASTQAMTPTPATRAPAARKSVAKKAPARKAGSATPAKKTAAPTPAPRKAAVLTRALTRPAAPIAAAAPTAAAPDARMRVIESLQRMGDKRPTKRKGLERHVESHLGRKLEPGALQALMEQLERDGVLAFKDNKVEYQLPRGRR